MSKSTFDNIEDLPEDFDELGGQFVGEFGEYLEYKEGEELGKEEEEESASTIYDATTFISGAYQSPNSTIPLNILAFYHGYGYDCKKLFNLAVVDPDTLVFACGNFVNFLNVETKEVTFRRTALGGGIGGIKINPNPEYQNHIAIAEHGYKERGLIIIYEWPELNIFGVLKGGTSKYYSHIDYSFDGMLLASQSGEPDFLITIFKWQSRQIILRTKSYVNDVYRVKFSPFTPGILTTCGLAHIKFWKMANTFTGLKLKGEVGKFGKTEFTDIEGVLPMADEKVCSGCNWGNILVWDDGKIKLEVTRTARTPCHTGEIVQLFFDEEGLLWTVAKDGHVKVWSYETIDSADPPYDDRVISIEPIYDFHTPTTSWRCLRKRYKDDPEDTTFFGQDGNGGIWLIDLSTDRVPKSSKCLMKTHAGKIVDMASCPWGPYVVSLGEGGKFFLYEYISKRLPFSHKFPAKGTCFLWLNSQRSTTGDELFFGFDDGAIRVCILAINRIHPEKTQLYLTQIVKPHDGPVVRLEVNPSNKILVSGGGDNTIFIFKIEQVNQPNLVPIGYINIPSTPTYFTWDNYNPNEIIIGCSHSEILQVELPVEPVHYTKVSYLLDLEIKYNKFVSYKSMIRRIKKIAEINERKQKKIERKLAEIEMLKVENPGLEIDVDRYLEDSETEEELEPLYYPEVPNKIHWIQPTAEGSLILSMGGYDAGYLYEYFIDQKDPVPHRYQMVYDADDQEIYKSVYNYNKEYLIFAMQNGEVRVNKLKDKNIFDLSDYWLLTLHNNLNSYISNMCFSYDEKFFFTSGHDGSVFFMQFNPEPEHNKPATVIPIVKERIHIPETIEDKPYYEVYTIEKQSLKMEEDRINTLANANKQKYRDEITVLKQKFVKLRERNDQLLPTQVISIEELEIDPRVTQYIHEKLDSELKLLERKMAFDVEKSKIQVHKLQEYLLNSVESYPITVYALQQKDWSAACIRNRKIKDVHFECMQFVDERIRLEKEKKKVPERAQLIAKLPSAPTKKEKSLEYFLLSLSKETLENRLGPQMTRLLQKYRERHAKWNQREEQWEQFLTQKPKKGVNRVEDIDTLKLAKSTIGNFRLKSDPTFKAPAEERETTLEKYKQLLETRIKQSSIKSEYNARVYELRSKKEETRNQLLQLVKKLQNVQKELPSDLIEAIPPVPPESPDEYPQRNYEQLPPLDISNIGKPPIETHIIINTELEFDVREHRLLQKEKVSCEYKYHPRDITTFDFERLYKLSEDESKETVWERELREKRFQRKILSQKKYLNKMNRLFTDFDNDVFTLNDESYEVAINTRWMDHYTLMITQQLMVLQDFESLEDNLSETVNQKTIAVLDMSDEIDKINHQLKEHYHEIEKLTEEGKDIQQKFLHAVHDNKFYDFLRRVFKKKYRPPKVRGDDESSSESSSSSSSSEEEDDTASVDSRDFGIIKLDLNTCPKGCELAIYDLTIDLRSQRYNVEAKIRDETKMIELAKKEAEVLNKKIKLLQNSQQESQIELERYQREKQNRLNEIRCLVFLHMDQLQHLDENGAETDILECLVFSKHKLSRLYKRVDELDNETVSLRMAHEANIMHLKRINTDIKYMQNRIKNLKMEMSNIIRQKFGLMIDIDTIQKNISFHTFLNDDIKDLEEVMLRKHVYDLRMQESDFKSLLKEEIKLWNKNFEQITQSYIDVLQGNTDRNQLLAIMSREKIDLARYLSAQERKKEHMDLIIKNMMNYEEECKKLKYIVDCQRYEIEDIKVEIKHLKTKGLPPKAPRPPYPEFIKELPSEVEVYEEGKAEDLFAKYGILREIPQTAENITKSILREMLKSLDVVLEDYQEECFIRTITEHVINRVSITVLFDEFIKNLPLPIEDEEKLMIIHDTLDSLLKLVFAYIDEHLREEEEQQKEYTTVQEIIDDLFDTVKDLDLTPSELCANLINAVVNYMPIEKIRETNSLQKLAEKIIEISLEGALDRKEMDDFLTECGKEVLNEALEVVFATGTDYIYVIKE